jgi:hypothetical protein
MIVDVPSHAWPYPQGFTDARKNMVECLKSRPLPIERRAAHGAEGTGMNQLSQFARRTDVASRTLDIHHDVRAHNASPSGEARA